MAAITSAAPKRRFTSILIGALVGGLVAVVLQPQSAGSTPRPWRRPSRTRAP